MSLKDIYCQDRAIEVFQKALACDRLGHAYIFGGLEGVGKFKTAFEWAKVLLCENRLQEQGFFDSCGKCRSCKLFEQQSHPDFHHVYKELYAFTEKGKSSNKTPVQMPVDVIREFLLDKVAGKPAIGNYSIYVISETEKLNAASQNAMLKVLEEPPGYCILILLCTSMDKLLPTTRSRCQLVRFNSIDENIIAERLANEGIEDEQAKFWARFCQGSLGNSIVWSGLGAYEFKCDIVKKICISDKRDIGDIVDLITDNASTISGKWSEMEPQTSKSDLNRRVQKAVIEVFASVYRDCSKISMGIKERLINSDQIPDIRKLKDRLEPENCCEKVEKCYKALKWVDSNVNERLIYERLLLELAK